MKMIYYFLFIRFDILAEFAITLRDVV